MSDITREDVAHLARLARLAVTADEIDLFAGQLDAILDVVAPVGEIGDEVEPTSHVVPLTNVLRADEVIPGLDREAALAAAPRSEEGRFRVPRILGEGA